MDVDGATKWLDTLHSSDAGPDPNAVKWSRCASEGELCDCSYQHSWVRLIRYGSPAKSEDPDGGWQWDYAHGEASNDAVLCHPLSFMHRDPAPGFVKHCECAHAIDENVPPAPTDVWDGVTAANKVVIPADHNFVGAPPPPRSPPHPSSPPPAPHEKLFVVTTPPETELETLAVEATTTAAVAETMANEIEEMAPEMRDMADELHAMAPEAPEYARIMADEMEVMASEAQITAGTAEVMTSEIEAMAPSMSEMADAMEQMEPEIDAMAPDVETVATAAAWTASEATWVASDVEEMAPEMFSVADELTAVAASPEMHAVAPSMSEMAVAMTNMANASTEMTAEATSVANTASTAATQTQTLVAKVEEGEGFEEETEKGPDATSDTTTSEATTSEATVPDIPYAVEPNKYIWQFCARDGDDAPCVCETPGVLMRFGSTGRPEYYDDGSRWFQDRPEVRRFDYASLPIGTNSIKCGQNSFTGSDPFPNQSKVCQCANRAAVAEDAEVVPFAVQAVMAQLNVSDAVAEVGSASQTRSSVPDVEDMPLMDASVGLDKQHARAKLGSAKAVFHLRHLETFSFLVAAAAAMGVFIGVRRHRQRASEEAHAERVVLCARGRNEFAWYGDDARV